jgi:Zn-dependent protease
MLFVYKSFQNFIIKLYKSYKYKLRQQNYMFDKREIRHLVITTLVLGFALGFNDHQGTFVLSKWVANLFTVTLAVGFSFTLHQLAHKVIARNSGFDTEYRWWGIKSLKLRHIFKPSRLIKEKNKPFPRKIKIFGKKYLIESFPIGIAISLFITIVSNGYLFFLAIGQYNLVIKKARRVGRKTIVVSDYEEAKIALAGPMTHIIIMTIFSFFNTQGIFDTFIFINAAMALFYMLPIHKLDGTKIWFGSRILYVTSLIFIGSMVALVYLLPAIPMLIISTIAAIVGAAFYYYYTYFKS